MEELGRTFTHEMEVRATTKRDLRCMLMIRKCLRRFRCGCGIAGMNVVERLDDPNQYIYVYI